MTRSSVSAMSPALASTEWISVSFVIGAIVVPRDPADELGLGRPLDHARELALGSELDDVAETTSGLGLA